MTSFGAEVFLTVNAFANHAETFTKDTTYFSDVNGDGLTDLVHDGTYYVAEAEGGPVGCGGWSRRRTLFGGDRYGARDSGYLDPSREPAKIRAFFVHPGWARRGVAGRILETCEREARAEGFRALELMATLPGVKLYAARGYEAGAQVEYEIADGVTIEFVPMRKELSGSG